MTPANSAVIARRPAQDGKPGHRLQVRGRPRRARRVRRDGVRSHAQLLHAGRRRRASRAARSTGWSRRRRGSARSSVVYDPAVLRTSELVDHLHGAPRLAPGRAGHDDPEPARAHAASRSTTRHRATPSSATCARSGRTRRTPRAATNIDYIVRYNGFAGREELYEAVLGTEQWTAFIGFFPGLPFMFPLDPRETVFVPKYNPTRTWTAEGAVGIGGPCCRDLPGRVGRRLPAGRPDAPDLRHPAAQRRVPGQPAAPPPRRPGPVPPGRGGRAAAGVRGRARRPLPLPDRGQPVRRRRVSWSGCRRSPTRRRSDGERREAAAAATPVP